MHERGFTLLEILVSVAIIALLAVPMIGAIGQTVVRTDENNTRIRALVPLENAGRWLGQDIRIAQATDLATSTSDVTLELTWTDWADSSQYDEYSSGGAVYKRYRATYALSGFANFSSIAIQLGGIGGIAPSRRHDLSRLGLRAMIAGSIAAFMTATVAGMIL